jgi:hypothetical protein
MAGSFHGDAGITHNDGSFSDKTETISSSAGPVCQRALPNHTKPTKWGAVSQMPRAMYMRREDLGILRNGNNVGLAHKEKWSNLMQEGSISPNTARTVHPRARILSPQPIMLRWGRDSTLLLPYGRVTCQGLFYEYLPNFLPYHSVTTRITRSNHSISVSLAVAIVPLRIARPIIPPS